MIRAQKRFSVGIVGSGITGLACAYFLKQHGCSITLYEQSTSSGGLAASARINDIPIEMFYHHFFTSDTELIDMAKTLGIEHDMDFYKSSVGMYVDKKLHPFSTPFDILRFSPLPLYDRIVLGLLTLYLTRLQSWHQLEKYTCKDLFAMLGAKSLYTKLWRPLLVMKFGTHADTIPASFLWGRIHPRGRSRRGSQEYLGYFKHGYHTFFEALEKHVLADNAKRIHTTVTSIESEETSACLHTTQGTYTHDVVIFTGSNGLLLKLCPSLPPHLKKKAASIEYQAINCMLLELNKQVSPYYWLNVLDRDVSFIGFIEHTNLVPHTRYNRHVAYVFNYLPVEDPLYRADPEDVFRTYTRDLRKLWPTFSKKDIRSWQLFRNPYATPIYSGTYSKRMLPHRVLPRIFVANTSQVYPEDRNVNNGIRLARETVDSIMRI